MALNFTHNTIKNDTLVYIYIYIYMYTLPIKLKSKTAKNLTRAKTFSIYFVYKIN